ncbi:hypothetical protein AVEN_269040-1 [Araneus ventricosus]|uniref:Uncharacterized protein n=1 Tax=Araneus ventricosus TaxID=182803 RepID=A0A4Y2W7V2_ARAVE|nr:hypothetical protein AVEN_269040-1 [Araneus ventricosus]
MRVPSETVYPEQVPPAHRFFGVSMSVHIIRIAADQQSVQLNSAARVIVSTAHYVRQRLECNILRSTHRARIAVVHARYVRTTYEQRRSTLCFWVTRCPYALCRTTPAVNHSTHRAFEVSMSHAVSD